MAAGGVPYPRHAGLPFLSHVQSFGLQHATPLLPEQPHATNGGSHTYNQLGTTPPTGLTTRDFAMNPLETARIWSGKFMAAPHCLCRSPLNGMPWTRDNAAR